MEMDDFIDRPLQNIPLEAFFRDGHPFELLKFWIPLKYEQLAQRLNLDTETAVQCESEEPVERALRTWFAMYGKESTIGNFEKQLLRDGHKDLLKSVLDFLDIFENVPSWIRQADDDISNSPKFNVLLACDDDYFASAFLESFEKRHNLKVCCPERDFMPGRIIANETYTLMKRSRVIVLALPAKATWDQELWAKLEQQLAVHFSAVTPRTLIPVLYEKSSVPLYLEAFSPLIKRDKENLDQFCDRICNTIIDKKKLLTGVKSLFRDQVQQTEKKAAAHRRVLQTSQKPEPEAIEIVRQRRYSRRWQMEDTYHPNSCDQHSDVILHIPPLSTARCDIAVASRNCSGESGESGYNTDYSQPDLIVERNFECSSNKNEATSLHVTANIGLDTGNVHKTSLYDAEFQRPIFSSSWQFSKTFTSRGGHLRAVDSDIILTVPAKAVDDGSGEEPRAGMAIALDSMGRIKYTAFRSTEQISLFTPDATDLRLGSTSAQTTTTAGVTIHGAISTDLKGVYETLKLSATESICSPVVEYYAEEHFVFKKPVCISLPHFLPPDANEHEVKVYQVNRDQQGEINVEILQLVPRDTFDETHEEKNDTSTADATSHPGQFYFSEENRISIVTDHFTAYFCSHGIKQAAPFLSFHLYGRHVRRKTPDVDLSLYIWDGRIDNSDFRKKEQVNSNGEMALIARKTLGRIGTDAAAEVDVGVRIHLSSQDDASDSNEQGVTWMHKTRDGTRLRFSPIKRIELERFCSCPGLDRPETVTWALQARSDPIEMKSTERYLDVGYVDVGYVRKGQGKFEFMPDSAAPFETLPVWVEVTECTRTHSTERVSPQAWSPMETGELQGAMANPQRSDSNFSAGNLLYGPGSLPPSYHHTPSFRHQGQPTVSERGFAAKTVVNINKVVANNVDLASMLHPQENGRESYMRSATETCLASGRAGSDQDVEETDKKSLISSSGQGAHLNGNGNGWHSPGIGSSRSSVSRRDDCRSERSHDEEGNETHGEDRNGSTLQATEAASPVSLEQSNGSLSSQNRERHSFQLQSPVPCSADVATNGTNGGHVPENDDSLSETLTNMDIVEDLVLSTSAKDVCSL